MIILYANPKEVAAIMLFWGGFLAVAIAITVITLIVRHKIRRFSQQVFGSPHLLKSLQEVDTLQDHSPRSLNGCDNLLLPKILKDFPDFDVNLAKTYARDTLMEKLSDKNALTIYNVVIAKYLPSAVQKTIVFQAAASCREEGELRQMRYDLHYTYLVKGSDESIAANCPNCGGALGYGVTVCPYCGSRVTNPLANAWHFTDILES